MSRIAYVNGSYVPHAQAAVHVEDRGYQFADGVYEVCAIKDGHLIDEKGHLDRLGYSLAELGIHWPMTRRAFTFVMRQVVRRNHIRNGILYIQVTRGVAPRNHAFPGPFVEPAVVMTAKAMNPFVKPALGKGVSVITTEDLRWKRRDIKSISLLPNCLGKEAAVQAGAYEAWMVEEDGTISEGTSSNAWIVTQKKELITRKPTRDILNGITRMAVTRLAKGGAVTLVERPFTLKEARKAAEAFITSTTSAVKPVTKLDGKPVGDGKVGPITKRLLALYLAYLDGEGSKPDDGKSGRHIGGAQ